MDQTYDSRMPLWRRLLRDRSGNVATEFALILPVTVLMMGGLIEFGLAVNHGTSLENGARAGAQYALQKGLDEDGITATVQAASNLTVQTGEVSTAEFYECSGAWGTVVDSTTNCGTGIPLAKFIRVTVTQPYTSFLPFVASLVPASMQGSATVRVPW